MRILGTGSALPALSVSNETLAAFLDTSDEWIKTRTGIENRHILRDETLTDLAQKAAISALENAGIRGDEVDLILGTTTHGEHVVPGVAVSVQRAIGADCPCMDLNAACTGFIYALDAASAYLESGKAKKILIISAEWMTRLCDWKDRSTCVLFGDGAGAVVLDNGEGVLDIRLTASYDEKILSVEATAGNCPFAKPSAVLPGVHMAGQEVFRFAVSHAAKDIDTVIQNVRLTLDDIDWFLLHQANRRIMEAVRQRLNQDERKFPANIQSVGNTSSASIPILLDQLNREGLLKPGQLIAMSAFGAGLLTGALVMRWSRMQME